MKIILIGLLGLGLTGCSLTEESPSSSLERCMAVETYIHSAVADNTSKALLALESGSLTKDKAQEILKMIMKSEKDALSDLEAKGC